MRPHWYVLHTHPRVEYLAADQLAGDGFEVFLPKVKTVSRRQSQVESPMFPGYLFIRCLSEIAGQALFRPIHRISGWVNFGGYVPSIPDHVISELAAKVEQINAGEGLWRRFQPGEKVLVVSPNMESLAEVVQEAKSAQGRAKVLLQFMGRTVLAQVPWEHLRPMEGPGVENQRVPRRTRGGGRWVREYKATAASRGLA